jgi:hypothetical protein
MHRVDPLKRRLGSALLISGLALFALSLWGLSRDVAWIAQPFYIWAWWSYITILDGFSLRRRGHSLLTRRPRLVPVVCLWSVTFWFFFELLNLRFQNWYYVGVFRVTTLGELAGSALFTVLAFSTVFLGIFETCEALAAAGLWRGWRGRPGRLPAWASWAVQALGLAMAAAAVLFPRYLAPLIWGSFTFIVDPWNYRRGARSILADLEARNWGLFARVFAGGLACGLVWESLNFFAPQKWIYTVRGLEELKLFEMPLLGFLGFPALAFDCLAAFALLSSWFLGNATWEHPDDLTGPLAPRPPPARRLAWAALVIQPCFWALVAAFLMEVNVGSVELRLDDLDLYPEETAGLAAAGIRRPGHLLRAAASPEGRARVARAAGFTEERAASILARAELFSFKGIGARAGRLLERAGVRSVDEIAASSPEDLWERLLAAAEGDVRPLRLDMVRVWVLASRSRGIFSVAPRSAPPRPRRGRPRAPACSPEVKGTDRKARGASYGHRRPGYWKKRTLTG